MNSYINPTGPKVLIIRLLEACNAGCFMCAFRFSKDSYRFSVDNARKLAEEIKLSDIKLVRFTGGEPLLHQDIQSIIKVFSDIQIKTSIITNGSHLSKSIEDLFNVGLSQIIVSIDAADNKHDKFRKFPGLFDSAMEGFRLIKERKINIKTRVNTVVGPHNYNELIPLYNILTDLDIQDWSLIPLKTEQGAWRQLDAEDVRLSHQRFVKHVINNPGPRLLGYSLNWMGRDDVEIQDYLNGNKNIAPRGKCHLVNKVRYYTPKDDSYYPCNCVSHRENGSSLAQKWNIHALKPKGLGDEGRWLHENGPEYCKGCEPANAALGEGSIDLDTDIFAY